jgi:hypothetical protein
MRAEDALTKAGAPTPVDPVLIEQVESYQPELIAQSVVAEHVTAIAEVGYACNPETGAVSQLGVDCDHLSAMKRATRSEQVTGVADVVWTEAPRKVDGDFIAVVRDWKTGEGDVEPAKTNEQLRLLAYLVSQTIDVDAVRVEVAHVGRGGQLTIDAHEHSALDLLAVADDLADVIDQASMYPRPNPGAHCSSQYCPLLTVCPATSADVQTALALDQPAGQEQPFPLVLSASQITSEQHAAYLVTAALRVRSVVYAVLDAAKAWGQTHGSIDLGGGDEYAATSRTVEQIRASVGGGPELVQAILDATGLAPERLASLAEVSVPLDALRQTIMEGAPNREKGAAVAKAWEMLRAAGVLTVARKDEAWRVRRRRGGGS